MDAGRITHFGSFEEVRDAGAAFALAARAGTSHEVEAQTTEIKSSDEMQIAEEEDEEMLWEKSKTSKWGAYRFFFTAVGPLFTIVVALLTFCYGVVRAGLQYVISSSSLFHELSLTGLLFHFRRGFLKGLPIFDFFSLCQQKHQLTNDDLYLSLLSEFASSNSHLGSWMAGYTA